MPPLRWLYNCCNAVKRRYPEGPTFTGVTRYSVISSIEAEALTQPGLEERNSLKCFLMILSQLNVVNPSWRNQDTQHTAFNGLFDYGNIDILMNKIRRTLSKIINQMICSFL